MMSAEKSHRQLPSIATNPVGPPGHCLFAFLIILTFKFYIFTFTSEFLPTPRMAQTQTPTSLQQT